jgi:hypothetical protein
MSRLVGQRLHGIPDDTAGYGVLLGPAVEELVKLPVLPQEVLVAHQWGRNHPHSHFLDSEMLQARARSRER